MKIKILKLISPILFLNSCQYLPDIAKNIESMETDTAIKVEISRETFQKETDLDISINVQNKDDTSKKPSKTINQNP